MDTESTPEPTPEPPVTAPEGEGGGEDENYIGVYITIAAPWATHGASMNVPLDAPAPRIAEALAATVRGAGHTYNPLVGEIINALIRTGGDTGVWLNPAREDEVAQLAPGERLSLAVLNNITVQHRRNSGQTLRFIKFHPGKTVPVEAIRMVLHAAGAA
jgi:hypothetical protein